MCILHACCFGPSFSFGWKQLVPRRRKPGCIWRVYLSSCSRWQWRWDCAKFGSLLPPQSSIAVPTSSQPLHAPMACSTCPQHHVTITLPSLFFWHLEWKKDGAGGGEEWCFRVGRATGESWNLCWAHEHSQHRCWCWSGCTRAAPHPWAGKLPGEDTFGGVDVAFESNSLPWQPNISTDVNGLL